MQPDIASDKSGYAMTANEKGLALPTVAGAPLQAQRNSTLSRVLGHRPNNRQKRLLALGAAYLTACLTFKAWSLSRREGSVSPFDSAFADDGYMHGLMGQGWSFASMQDRNQPSIEEGGIFFSQLKEHKHKGEPRGHGHRHHKPPFRHVTPQEAEEIFFKVPNNDRAAA
jgi:hypothetical protein